MYDKMSTICIFKSFVIFFHWDQTLDPNNGQVLIYHTVQDLYMTILNFVMKHLARSKEGTESFVTLT